MIKIKNRGYDESVFTVYTERKEVALLSGVGRFCKCGCKKSITGRKDKEFYNSTCRRRYYDRVNGKPLPKNHVDAIMNLQIINEPFKHRLLTLYFKLGKRIQVKITPDNKELWNVLEKIVKYRSKPI